MNSLTPEQWKRLSNLSRSNRTASQGYKVACLFLLTGLLPVLLLSGIPHHIPGPAALLTGIAVYSGARLTILAFQNKHCFLEITYWLFVYCWIALAGAAQVWTDSFPWDAIRQSPENLWKTTLVISAGLIGYEIGVKLAGSRSRQRLEQWFVVPTFSKYATLTVCCIVASMYGISVQGGITAALGPRYLANAAFDSGDILKSELLTYTALQHGPPLVALLVTIYLIKTNVYRGASRTLLRAFFIFLVLFNLIANFPPSLARVTLGSTILSIFIVVFGAQPKLRPVFIVTMVVTIVLLFPYLDWFRTPEGYQLTQIHDPRDVMVTKADYDAFQMISNTVSTIDETGVDHGYNLFGSVLFFVPRSIWPAKPYGLGARVGEHIGYRFLNLSSPLWGEFYCAGGFVLVPLAFVLYGFGSGRLQNETASTKQPLTVLLAYAAGFQIFLLRGDLLSGIAYSLPSILLIGCYLLRIGNKQRTR